MMETNFLSVVALTKEVVKGMVARNRGHIVMMSSIAGKEGYHGALQWDTLRDVCCTGDASHGCAFVVRLVERCSACLVDQRLPATVQASSVRNPCLHTAPTLQQMHTVLHALLVKDVAGDTLKYFNTNQP